MDKKVCLDTDVCIELIKGNPALKGFIQEFDKSAVFISSITVFELFLRETNLSVVNDFIESFAVLLFDKQSALGASSVFKQLKKKGHLVDTRDLFIAAVCLANGCTLATLNKKHFDKIAGLTLAAI